MEVPFSCALLYSDAKLVLIRWPRPWYHAKKMTITKCAALSRIILSFLATLIVLLALNTLDYNTIWSPPRELLMHTPDCLPPGARGWLHYLQVTCSVLVTLPCDLTSYIFCCKVLYVHFVTYGLEEFSSLLCSGRNNSEFARSHPQSNFTV